MKCSILGVVVLCMAGLAAGQKGIELSGSWQFNPGKSKNVGMMAQMKIWEDIVQTNAALDIVGHGTFMGKEDQTKTHYDLTGKPATNLSPMAGPSETISKWVDGKLVTTWASESAVPGGPKSVRTETRSLSADGKTMTVESVREPNAPVVMVFDRK